MLWTIFVILLVLWLLGFSFHIAGSLIHLLLVVAVVVLVINLISGRLNRLMLWRNSPSQVHKVTWNKKKIPGEEICNGSVDFIFVNRCLCGLGEQDTQPALILLAAVRVR